VHYWLSNESVQWHLLNSAKEVARKTLNLSDLARIPLALPSPEEQELIANRVTALFGLADQIEIRHAVVIAQAQRLTPLTLAKAFRGELVPQDPDDEPASALLARIASQRAALATEPKARQPRRARAPRAPKEAAAMTKSRQDDDVMGQPYLANHLRRLGASATAEALFKVAELPVTDFYKQLAWEVAQGHVKDNQTSLELGHAAG
jgi:type I restriction enzyme S subunit